MKIEWKFKKRQPMIKTDIIHVDRDEIMAYLSGVIVYRTEKGSIAPDRYLCDLAQKSLDNGQRVALLRSGCVVSYLVPFFHGDGDKIEELLPSAKTILKENTMINEPVLVCKTYVEFLYPGIIVSESSSKEVQSRDISTIEIPGGAFALKFYDIEYNEVKIDGKVLKDEPKRCRETGWQYLGGEVLTLADVEKKMPSERILISNMEWNKIKKVVKTKFGQCMPMEKGDCVI